jgi:RNA polymerase-binding transcription factor
MLRDEGWAMRLSQTELSGYKCRLEEWVAELGMGIRFLDRIAVERAPDEVENVQLSGERDLVITQLDREAALLAEIRAALGRIDDGSYGICFACGREIGRARLTALPWASCCIACQEVIDRRRAWAAATNGQAA